MGNSGCCAEAWNAARAGAQDANTDETPLLDEKEEKSKENITKLESQLEKADKKIKLLDTTCQEQTEKITDLESELNDAKTAMQQNEQQRNDIESELQTIKTENERLSKLENKDQSSRIQKLSTQLEKTKTSSQEKLAEQNKTIAKLAKQLRKFRDHKNKMNKLNVNDIGTPADMSDYSEMDYSSMNSDADEEDKYDEDDDLQKILFAEEYVIEFTRKPFGFTFGTNKKLYRDTKNLFVKHIDRNSTAERMALIIGSKLVKFNDEIVEDLGGKEIQQIFHRKYYDADGVGLPIKITFKKPIFANAHFQRIYELEAELENVNKEIKHLMKKRGSQGQKIDSLLAELESYKSLNRAQNAEILALKEKLEEYRRADTEQDDHIMELETQLNNARGKIREIQDDNNEKIHEIMKINAELKATKDLNEKERERLEQLQLESTNTNYTLSELENKNTALMEAISELTTNLRTQKATEEQKKYISSKMAFIQGANVEQYGDIRRLKRELRDAKNTVAARDGKVDDISSNIIKVQKERIKDISKELTDARILIDELESKNYTLNQKLRKLDAQVMQAKRDKHIIFVEKNDAKLDYNMEPDMKNNQYFELEEKQNRISKQKALAVGLTIPGLSAEDAAKSAKKYNLEMEKAVVDWINAVVGDRNMRVMCGGPEKFKNSLKNGVILCRLVNILQPKSVKTRVIKANIGKTGAMANFADKQRINEFSRVAKEIGLSDENIFGAEDLFDGKNMTAVLFGLYSFGSMCRREHIVHAKGGI